MRYLVHTSHSQLGALPLGCIGWTLTLTALGLIQWRVWYVDDLEYVTSGLAWVGVWRACFYSHTLVSPEFRVMFCRSIGFGDIFAPTEVKAAQVLMLASAVLGLLGNALAVYALRNVHLGLDKGTLLPIRAAFRAAGGLLLLAAAASLAPLGWNAYAVVNNHTIAFPPGFHLPPAPVSQKVGAGIMVGIIASVLTLTSGVMYLNYRLPKRSGPSARPSLRAGASSGEPAASGSGDETNNRRVIFMSDRGIDNPGFESV